VPGMSVVAEVRLNQDVKPTQTAAAR